MKDVTAIILAAGLGTRMKSVTPKVLHRIGSKTLLERVVENLENAGIEDIVVVLGYKAHQVEALFADRIKCVRQTDLLGSGDAVKQAIKKYKKAKNHILVTCGDTPLIENRTYKALIKKHLYGNNACTVLTSVADNPFSYGRIVRGGNNAIVEIVEEKDASEDQRKINEINVGTYCFNKKTLNDHIDLIKQNKKKKEFYLTDIVRILSTNKNKVVSRSCEFQQSIGINSRKELAMANEAINSKTIEKLMRSGVTITDPRTTCIDETALVKRDTIIYSNTVVEADVKIGEGCKIGPFARIRSGTKIARNVEIGNFVETVRSSIGEGSRVKHHTYLGDTIVGKNVNIGAGTITANYDGKNKNKTVIENGVFIGVGVTLIAPVKVGKKAKVGAGSVVTKNKNVSAGETVIGIPARTFKKK